VFGILAATSEVPLTDEILAVAERLDPPELRTLYAIHLASALSLGEALDAVLTYDVRLQAAAAHAGLSLLAPA
jgi:predicted nucleic acid-binding protein